MRAAIIGVSWCKCGLIAGVISFHWITCHTRSRSCYFRIGLIFSAFLTLLQPISKGWLAASMDGFWVSNSCKFMEIFNEGYFVNSHPLETNIWGGNLPSPQTDIFTLDTSDTCFHSLACFDSGDQVAPGVTSDTSPTSPAEMTRGVGGRHRHHNMSKLQQHMSNLHP